MSGVVPTEFVMPEADAERLTRRITLMAGTLREGMEKLHGLVAEAKAGNAHVALGYPSWTAYLADVLGKEPLRLERAARQELVGYLSGEGMSTRAIAPIVGASVATVKRDVSGGSSEPPAPPTFRPLDVTGWTPEEVADQQVADEAVEEQYQESVAEWEARTGHRVDRVTGEVIETPQGEVAPLTPSPARPAVTGIDGKTYSRPEPRPRQMKRSDAETYLNLVVSHADQAAREAEKLTPAQIERVKPNAALWVGGIRASMETLQRLLTSLTEE